MGGQRSSSKAGLFLMELIIAITFFSVASAICIQLFTQAHLLGRKSQDIHNAMTLAQSYAEEFKAAPAEGEASPEAELYYGVEDGLPVCLGTESKPDARYRMTVRYPTDEDGLRQMELTVETQSNPTEEPLYQITVSTYSGQQDRA